MKSLETSCVVFGAGALGLGFIGPELSPNCRITYVDIAQKQDLLRHLARAGHYALNMTGLSVRSVSVGNVSGLCLTAAAPAEIDELMDRADLVFTAVGERNLPKLAPLVADAAARRPAGRPLRVACGENGVEVARKLRAAVQEQACRPLPERLLVGDTVMGRMCKLVQDPEPPLEPIAPGLDYGVVSEPYYGIPVEERVLAGLEGMPEALRPQAPALFAASEDTKMLAHNGLHAALGCLGWLRDARRFDQLRDDAQLMELAHRLLTAEVAPALLRKHGAALDRSELLNYTDWILRRTTCPVFADPIERGVRGIMRKLEPWERLVYGLRTVAQQGIEPEVFAGTVAAAAEIAVRTGATELDFDRILTEHCRLDAREDAHLLTLVRAARP